MMMTPKTTWKASGKRHETSLSLRKLKASEWPLVYRLVSECEVDVQVNQHDIANPRMLTTMRTMPFLPLFVGLLHSVAQIGAVTVFAPFPMPATTLVGS